MLFGEDADKPKTPRAEGSAPVAGGAYTPRTPSEHPLAMQFRRERRTTGSSSDWRSRGASTRPARPGFSKDRKPGY